MTEALFCAGAPPPQKTGRLAPAYFEATLFEKFILFYVYFFFEHSLLLLFFFVIILIISLT